MHDSLFARASLFALAGFLSHFCCNPRFACHRASFFALLRFCCTVALYPLRNTPIHHFKQQRVNGATATTILRCCCCPTVQRSGQAKGVPTPEYATRCLGGGRERGEVNNRLRASSEQQQKARPSRRQLPSQCEARHENITIARTPIIYNDRKLSSICSPALTVETVLCECACLSFACLWLSLRFRFSSDHRY